MDPAPGAQSPKTSPPALPESAVRGITAEARSVIPAESNDPTINRIASVIRNAPTRQQFDPGTPWGLPPNFGSFVLPHAMTMQGLINGISKTYLISDEALEQSFDNARFMEYDVGIREALEGRIRPTGLLDWYLEPEDEGSHEQKDLCDKLTKIIERTHRFMQMRKQLLWATWYGRKAAQLKLKWEECLDGEYVIAEKWKDIHGDKLVWRLDDGSGDVDPDQIGIRVGSTYKEGSKIAGKWEVLPTDRGMAYFLKPWERKCVVLHQHECMDAFYERPRDAGRINGTGIRNWIYWEWFQKQQAQAWLMEFLERNAFGIYLWFYPLGNPQALADTTNAILNRIGNDRNNILVPVPPDDTAHQYGCQPIESNMAGVQAIKEILTDYFGHRIKRLICGQTLTSEGGSAGLGSNLPSVLLGVLLDIVREDATNLGETLTVDFVRNLQLWNFPSSRRVNVRFKIKTEEVNQGERLEMFSKAHQMGVDLREKDILDCIGASVIGPDDKVIPGTVTQSKSPDGEPGLPPGQGGAQTVNRVRSLMREHADRESGKIKIPAQNGA